MSPLGVLLSAAGSGIRAKYKSGFRYPRYIYPAPPCSLKLLACLLLATSCNWKLRDKPVPVRTKALFSRLGKDRPVWVRTDMRPYQNGYVHLGLTKTGMCTWALPKRVCDGPYQNGDVHLVLTKTGM